MERYKTRPGVVLTEIAGEYLLVAAKALHEECPYLTQLNESSAFLWRLLESGACFDELERAVTEEYEPDDPAEAREAIRDFIQQMIEMNYLEKAEDQS